MRKVVHYVAKDGTVTYRIRYRHAGTYTSETFRQEHHAQTFAAILGSGKTDNVADALTWLAGLEDTTATATFGDWFDTWVSQLTAITQRTRADYRALHRRYLSSLDPLPLSTISRAHVAALVAGMEATHSPKTIKHAFNMLSTCLSVAVDDGLIPRNPCKRVKLPKVTSAGGGVLFLTEDEAARIVAACKSEYRPLLLFLFGTGLRWSEATALQVRHVDLERGTVRVERAWKRVEGGFAIGTPKSEKSIRTVNAGVPALLAAKHLMDGRKPMDLLFTTPTGKPIRHANFYNRIWKPAVTAAGWAEDDDRRPTPHDARASHASWLVSDGIGLEAVQDQLGHESYETTRKVYAHLLPAVGIAAGRSASDAMARVLAAVEAADPPALSSPAGNAAVPAESRQ